MRITLLSIASFLLLNVSAQEYFHCATDDMMKKWFDSHPEQKAEFDKRQQESAELDKEQFKTNYGKNTLNNAQQKTTAAAIYTIPVVFHILHTGGIENITDAQIIDAVNILTRDFNKLNADTANVVSAFKTLIGNPQIDFKLATIDPNGNCTNGIIRHWDTKTDWTGASADYIYTWPRNKYLNVYVVRTMGSGAAGYTYLPGTVGASMDAIVILHQYVGSIGTGSPFRSRALTHEVGHWLDLLHVWGGNNNPGQNCNGDDFVSDTPKTKGHSSCNLNDAFCTPGVIENVQNYMEYAYCSNMFTIGQAARMTNAINSNVNFSARNNLSTPSNLAATGIISSSCPHFNIASQPSDVVCVGQPLSFVTYTYNLTPISYVWGATNDAVIADDTAPATSITFYTPGTAVVTCTTVNGNGTEVKSHTVHVISNVGDVTTTKHEGFENNVLPDNWSVNSSNSNKNWEITSDAAYEGAYSMVVKGEELAANTVLNLISPTYDFKNNPGAMFTFYYAYARQNSQNKDQFILYASKDCGATWYDVWTPSMNNTATNSGGITSELFYPVSDNFLYYDKLTISNSKFNQFKNEDHVLLRFYFIEDAGGTGFGNRFYLDEINFTAPTGVNELTKAISLNVYPNPASSEAKIAFTLSDAAIIKYSLTNVVGATVVQTSESSFGQGSQEITINTAKLNSGIYFINLELNGIKMSKKLVVNH